MKTTIHTLLTGLVLAALLSGCSKNSGYEAASNGTPAPSTGDNNNGQNNGGGNNNPGNTLDSVDMKGYVAGGDNEGLKSIDFDKVRGELILTVPVGLDFTVPLLTGSIQKYPDILFQTTKGNDGKTYFVIRVPVKYVLRGVNNTSPSRLPNGDPLPGVPAGEAPSVGFSLSAGDNRKVYIYMGVEVVAVYFETTFLSCQPSWPICPSTIALPIYNQNRTKQLGTFAAVVGKNGGNGGFYVATQIPPEMAKILDEYFMN